MLQHLLHGHLKWKVQGTFESKLLRRCCHAEEILQCGFDSAAREVHVDW